MASSESAWNGSLKARAGISGWPWYVGMLPFYYAPLNSPTNGDLPDSLPFALDIDLETGTLVQAPSEVVSDALSRAYLKGSMITGTMDEEGIGKDYAEDFLSFLTRSVNMTSFDGRRVLEVGCGTGYLLYRLKQSGASVLGLEPGPHGQEGSKRFNVPIIRDFFPSPKIDGKFDLIILYGVLEHVQSSSNFLSRLLTHLKQDGRVVVSVPDCEPYVAVGDISMLFCEHWGYYTQTSLRNSVKRFMHMDIGVATSSFGGSLYAITVKPVSSATVDTINLEAEVQKLLNYRYLAQEKLNSFLKYIEAATSKGESVGIYVPSRAINALCLLREKVDLSRVRFFDDNETLHGTYFPGFDIPVESRERLVNNPPERVLVMSHTFGRKIADELTYSVGSKSDITTWDDLFRN